MDENKEKSTEQLQLSPEEMAAVWGGEGVGETITWTCSKCGQSYTGSRIVVTSLKNQHMKQH